MITSVNKLALAKVLLDYYAAPGNYALNVGQPVLAFRHLDVVIAWAQGKISDEHAFQSDALQQAAVFFVQRACLRLENSHYEVLGIERGFSADALRLRYRALISLTHPDKAISGFPANAAVRINQAYDTLRVADERARYDASLSEELKGLPTRGSGAGSANDTLDKLDLGNRLQAYVPNFRKMVFFALPVLVIALVVVVLAVSQAPTDLQLVEKRSETKFANPLPSTPVVVELPQTAVASELSDTGRNQVLENTVSAPWASRTVADNLTPVSVDRRSVSDVNVQYQSHIRSKHDDRLSVTREQVNLASDADNTTIPTVVSKLQDPETVKLTSVQVSAPVGLASPVSLKLSGVMPAIPESKRLYVQLNEARFSVTQLISALERPKDAESLQSKMARQGVSGNLFGLAMPHIRQASTIRVDQLSLKERLENNRLILSGSVALWLGSTANQLMPYKYLVNVEFNDVETGPVMSSFDLKEAK